MIAFRFINLKQISDNNKKETQSDKRYLRLHGIDELWAMNFVKQLYANCLAKLEISKFLVSSSYMQCVSCYVIFFDREIYFVSTVEHMLKPVLLTLTIQDVITSLSHGIFVLNFKLSLVLKRLF